MTIFLVSFLGAFILAALIITLCVYLNKSICEVDYLTEQCDRQAVYIAELRRRLERHNLNREPVQVFLLSPLTLIDGSVQIIDIARNGNVNFRILMGKN